MKIEIRKNRILKNCKHWFEVEYFKPELVPQFSYDWSNFKKQRKIIEVPCEPFLSNTVIQLYILMFSIRIELGVKNG